MAIRIPDDIRFWKYVKKSPYCWAWTGHTNGRYGILGISGTNKFIVAHRLSWKLHLGDIPLKMEVCHRCDNTRCVNPKHLFLATHAINMLDCKVKGRGRSLNGSLNKNSKLNETKVLKIRELWKNGSKRIDLSRKYKITKAHITLITKRRLWKHI